MPNIIIFHTMNHLSFAEIFPAPATKKTLTVVMTIYAYIEIEMPLLFISLLQEVAVYHLTGLLSNYSDFFFFLNTL